jgi:spermidine dehydrogenase
VSIDDKALGMNRRISRRDFVNGVSVAVAGAALSPMRTLAYDERIDAEERPEDYPPLKTGMRGSHEGSFEVAHQLRDRGAWDLTTAEDTHENYDLVVVGGGISGLSAAHFFLKDVKNARVLILDNHDDFGGHAKRNEFHYKGRTLAINGGTLNIESPLRYNAPARQILQDIGVDLDRYRAANQTNRALYKSLRLRPAYFFDKETWGTDRLVGGGVDYENEEGDERFSPAFLARTPLSENARRDMRRLFAREQPDYLPDLSSAQKKLRLAKMSYNDFLLNLAKVDKEVLWFFQNVPASLFAVGSDATPALFCWQMGFPGFAGLKLEPTPMGVLSDLPGGQHGRQDDSDGGGAVHFPDGNATVARLLVRSLIPAAVPGTTMEDVATARVDYTLLDRPGQPARVRLNSTVVNVRHKGDPQRAGAVTVAYVRGGKTYSVEAVACIMACWNMMIPALVPDLSASQKEALSFNVKAPIVYTSVVLRNWNAFQKLGVNHVSSPTMYHTSVALTEAASLGSLEHPQSPNDPIALHLVRTPCSPGKTRKEQHRIGRYDLLSTPFETFERSIRDQLGRVLQGGGFDPSEDIVAITVNRWPHGYSYTYNSLYDPLEWVFTNSDKRPCVIARQPFGSIAIANADAAASPHTDAAILEAHRAVGEILNRKAMPLLS